MTKIQTAFQCDGPHRPSAQKLGLMLLRKFPAQVVEMNRQLDVAEKLLSKATPHPTFLSMEQQENWAKDFGKWWAERMARKK